MKVMLINSDIRTFLNSQKRKSVRRNILPGNTKTLWNAVKTAKDQNVNVLPKVMFLNGLEVDDKNLSDTIANYFDKKVKLIVESTVINESVYNGRKK